MPDAWKTRSRNIRVDDDRWQRLGEAAESQSADRAGVIRALIRWYLREPGAKLPVRPEPPAKDAPAAD